MKLICTRNSIDSNFQLFVNCNADLNDDDDCFVDVFIANIRHGQRQVAVTGRGIVSKEICWLIFMSGNIKIKIATRAFDRR